MEKDTDDAFQLVPPTLVVTYTAIAFFLIVHTIMVELVALGVAGAIVFLYLGKSGIVVTMIKHFHWLYRDTTTDG